MTRHIETLVRAERWTEARRAIRASLRADPDNHWLVGRLGLTYYEQRRYPEALKHAARAVQLAPRCPLALWDYAGTLQMLDRAAEAIEVYRRITRRGARRIAHGTCGEGLARACGIVADAHLRLAESLAALGSRPEARRHLKKHLSLRGPGCESIYPFSDRARDRPALMAFLWASLGS